MARVDATTAAIARDFHMIGEALDDERVQPENHPVPVPRNMASAVRFGSYELIVDTQELWRDGRRVHVPPQAMRILLALTSSPDTVVTREELRAVLWPDGTHVDFEPSLNTAMRKLRAALGDDGRHPRYILRVPGRGYRFIAPVRDVGHGRIEQPDARTARGDRVTSARLSGSARAAAALILVTSGMAVAIAIGMAISNQMSRRADQPWPRAARGSAATTSNPALDAYRRGQAAARAGRREDRDAAIGAFETAVRIDPAFAPAWAALARTRATRAALDGRDPGELQLAEIEATRALTLDRELPDAYLATGLIRFVGTRDLAGAEVWMRRAQALGGTTGEEMLWFACVLNAQRRFGEALRVLDAAIAQEPRMAALHAWRGLMLHWLGRYDEELAALQHAAAIDPRSPEALFHLGMGYARRQQYDRALPAMRRAVSLSGGGGYYISWFGRMAADAGDLAAAEQAVHDLEAIARTRGLAPALISAVASHIDARRQRSGGPARRS